VSLAERMGDAGQCSPHSAASSPPMESIDERVPPSEDELHRYVLDTLGLDIPRVAVCEEHSSPMSILWECFSHAHPHFPRRRES
jgi:hypothetical protein